MKKLQTICVASVLWLAACGPVDVNTAADQAASTAASAANQAASAASSALTNIVPSNLQLQQDQPLVLDVTQQVANVTNYRWTIAEVPAGAESVEGQLIAENSDGRLTINPSDYAKYFPVPGTYQVDLNLTFGNGSSQTVPIPVIVP